MWFVFIGTKNLITLIIIIIIIIIIITTTTIITNLLTSVTWKERFYFRDFEFDDFVSISFLINNFLFSQ